MIAIDVYDDRREMKQHGTYEFPVAVYHYVMSDCLLGYINWHWHEEIQLCIVTHGKVCFQAEATSYELKAGEGFFINSGRIHMAKPVGDPDSAYVCLDFHPRLLGSFERSLFGDKYVQPYLSRGRLEHGSFSPDVPWQRNILEQIREITELYDRGEFGYELAISARIGLLWLSLISHAEQEKSVFRGENNAMIRQIMAYIQQHYKEQVALEDISRAVSFSDSECCRVFKKMTGETIFSYLKSYRLARSMELLEEGKLSVSEIAYETGFCSSSYYIEAFRRELGITPLQYRKTLTEQA